jgi:hypothetical protein
MTDKEISEILTFADSFTRFSEFLKISHLLKGKKYWETLNSVYTCSDNLYQFRHILKSVFLSEEPGREYLMSEEDRDIFDSLPSNFVIYRGMTEREFKSKSFGVSWTLNKEVAEFFAYRYWRNLATKNLKKTIHELTINKSDVIAYFHGRQEYEIIYIPKAVTPK